MASSSHSFGSIAEYKFSLHHIIKTDDMCELVRKYKKNHLKFQRHYKENVQGIFINTLA